MPIRTNPAISATHAFTDLARADQSPTPVHSTTPSKGTNRRHTTLDQIELSIKRRTPAGECLERIPELTPKAKRRESVKRIIGEILRKIAQVLTALLPVSLIIDFFLYPGWSRKKEISTTELQFSRDRLKVFKGTPIHIPVQSYTIGRIPLLGKSINLDGMVLPARNSEAKKTVLFCNPNFGFYESNEEVVEFYRNELNCNVVLFNYRGAGRSDGRPTTVRTLKDMNQIFDYVTNTLGVKPSDLLVHGRCLGGTYAAYLGSRQPEVTVICDRAFENLAEAAEGVVGGGKKGRALGNAAYTFATNDLSTHTLYQKAKGPKLCIEDHHDEMFPNYQGAGGDVIHLNSSRPQTHNVFSTTFKSRAVKTWVKKNFTEIRRG